MKRMHGFDNCIIGVIRCFGQEERIVYDTEKVIQTLMDNSGMTFEEALEFHEYNQLGAYVGEDTPAFVDRVDNIDEIRDYYCDEQ